MTISSAHPSARSRGLLVLLALAGCSDIDASFAIGGHDYPAEGLTQWALPPELREISGLALDDRGRLFAHGDEAAVIVELDLRQGRLVKRFALGDPPRRGDFEGLAWVGQRLWLVTSDGELLDAPEGGDGEHVQFGVQRTGLGRRCEIEGLDHDPVRGLLLMACKTPRQKALEGTVAVLAWSLAQRAPAPEQDLIVPIPATDGRRAVLHPSGLTRSTANGNLVLVAARQRALLELAPEGRIVKAFTMPRDGGHPQMEGIVMTVSGDLVIADEGGNQRGRLSVYAARQ